MLSVRGLRMPRGDPSCARGIKHTSLLSTNSVHERGLSVSDLGQTCEGMRKKMECGKAQNTARNSVVASSSCTGRGRHTRAESSQDVRYFSSVLARSRRSGKVQTV